MPNPPSPQDVMIEEFHLSLFVPNQLSRNEIRAIRRTLTGKQLRMSLLEAVTDHFRRYRSLNRTKVQITV